MQFCVYSLEINHLSLEQAFQVQHEATDFVNRGDW